MKELGIPGTALVIVQGDQLVRLKAFGVADACVASNPDKKAADWWTTCRCYRGKQQPNTCRALITSLSISV
jgi:hypothetical protein